MPQPNNNSTDLALIGRLGDPDDHESWSCFYESYWRLIYHFARDRGLSDAEAREVVQDTLVSVAKSLQNFRVTSGGNSSFRAWLRRLTQRRAMDFFRHLPKEMSLESIACPGSGSVGAVEKLPDPISLDRDSAWRTEWRDQVIRDVLSALKKRITARDYQVFHQVEIQELKASQAAKLFGINVAQVYLIRHRVRRQLDQILQSFKPRD